MPMPIQKLLHGKSAKPIFQRGAPVSVRDLPIPWNNMDQANNSEGEGVLIAPEPVVNEGIEELVAPETITKRIPGLSRRTPAWALSAVEGMENRVKKYSKTTRPGRGFRTRKEGGRRRKNTRRRSHKA